jgi:hypothetical protein
VLVHATPTQADAIVRAMKCVVTGDGAVALSAVDVAAIEACHHAVLHRQEPLIMAAVRPIAPAELAGLESLFQRGPVFRRASRTPSACSRHFEATRDSIRAKTPRAGDFPPALGDRCS